MCARYYLSMLSRLYQTPVITCCTVKCSDRIVFRFVDYLMCETLGMQQQIVPNTLAAYVQLRLKRSYKVPKGRMGTWQYIAILLFKCWFLLHVFHFESYSQDPKFLYPLSEKERRIYAYICLLMWCVTLWFIFTWRQHVAVTHGWNCTMPVIKDWRRKDKEVSQILRTWVFWLPPLFQLFYANGSCQCDVFAAQPRLTRVLHRALVLHLRAIRTLSERV